MKDFPAIAGDLRDGMKRYAEAAPETMQAFRGLMGATTADGALPARVKELIALAIGISVRCDGCIAHHVRAVRKAGASREEVVEAIGVAIMMGGRPVRAAGRASKCAQRLFDHGCVNRAGYLALFLQPQEVRLGAVPPHRGAASARRRNSIQEGNFG